MNKILLIALFFASGFVFLGAFLPWLSFKAQIPAGFPVDHEMMKEFMAEVMTLTGWKGEVTLIGITMPTWLIPIAALFVSITTACRCAGTWNTPRALSIGIALFCTIQLVTLLVVASANSETTRLGFGAILAMVGSLGMFGLTIFIRKEESIETVVTGYGANSYGSRDVAPQGLAQPSNPQPGLSQPNFPGSDAMEPTPPSGRVDPHMD